MTTPLNPLDHPSTVTSLLREFWSAVKAGQDALPLLHAWAEKRPSRRTVRSPQALRREHNAARLLTQWKGRKCFVCRDLASQEHHIVQLQHGGTNRADNKVWVCTPCHRRIHPQLALPPVSVPAGIVPYLKDSERQSTCPACTTPVLAVSPVLKKLAYPLAQSTRPILLHPDAQPPYRTSDIHHQHCLAKSTLNQFLAADLKHCARQDIRTAERVPS